MTYAHFTLKTRRELQDLYRCGKSLSEIARRLGMHRSTVCREIERNGYGNRKYDAWYAHKQAMGRKKRDAACKPGQRLFVKRIFGRVTGDYLFDHNHKVRRFTGTDESFRLIRDRRYLHYGGKNSFRKPLTALQKLLRRHELRNRLRLHDWENHWRTPRRWERVIRLSHHTVKTHDTASSTSCALHKPPAYASDLGKTQYLTPLYHCALSLYQLPETETQYIAWQHYALQRINFTPKNPFPSGFWHSPPRYSSDKNLQTALRPFFLCLVALGLL